MRAAIFFDNFGPYHWARVEAANRCADVLAIEVARASNEYAWNRRSETSEPSGAGVRTAFPLTTECLFDGTSEHVSGREISSRLDALLNSWNPDVVLIPGWSSRAAIASLRWCLRTGTPGIVMSETTPWDAARSWGKELIKKLIINCYTTALVGGSVHADYLVQLGFPQDRIFLGYDAVDNHYFSGKGEEIKIRETEIRSKHGLPEKFFLASARFIEKKNLAALLRAYFDYRQISVTRSDTHGDSEPWQLVILGDGELRTELYAIRSQLGLERYVHFPGFKQYEDLPTYYGTASAFIHASTTEQWGLVVNEAMASGLPVLVSNRCGCACELVREGENGFTFDPYQVDDMANCMMRVARPDFPLDSFALKSRQIIADWGPERFASGLRAATQKASEVGPVRPSLVQRVILSMLEQR